MATFIIATIVVVLMALAVMYMVKNSKRMVAVVDVVVLDAQVVRVVIALRDK